MDTNSLEWNERPRVVSFHSNPSNPVEVSQDTPGGVSMVELYDIFPGIPGMFVIISSGYGLREMGKTSISKIRLSLKPCWLRFNRIFLKPYLILREYSLKL